MSNGQMRLGTAGATGFEGVTHIYLHYKTHDANNPGVTNWYTHTVGGLEDDGVVNWYLKMHKEGHQDNFAIFTASYGITNDPISYVDYTVDHVASNGGTFADDDNVIFGWSRATSTVDGGSNPITNSGNYWYLWSPSTSPNWNYLTQACRFVSDTAPDQSSAGQSESNTHILSRR